MRIPSSGGMSGYAQIQALTTAANSGVADRPSATGLDAATAGVLNPLGFDRTALGATSLQGLSDLIGVSVPELSANYDAYSVSGPEVTNRYSGGTEAFGIIDADGTNTVFYATGAQPSATKSVLIKYGDGISEAAKTAARSAAFAELSRHLDDHVTADGSWDKSLFDTRA